MRTNSLFFFSLFLHLSTGTFAQTIDKAGSSNKLNTFFNQHIGKSSVIHSGPSYIVQKFPMDGSPFLGNDTLISGWISYDGHYYEDVLLQWDIFQNYVITEALVSNAKIILRNELIDSFSFAGHLVKYLPSDKESNLMHEGFYDILYKGPTTLMARRKKIARDLMTNNKIVYYMIDKSTHYIRKKGTYYLVNSKKDIGRLFAKEMGEIKRLARRNNLKWRKNFEQILEIAVVHYDKSNAVK